MIKINTLEAENLKRIKAIKMEVGPNGLTLIGGRNGQGKTSVLDAITYALGGERYRPSEIKREGSMVDPYIKIELSNGLVVERKGKNSSLKVTDPSGKVHGQKLLTDFLTEFSLDLPKFLASSAKEKTNALLRIIGVGDKLLGLDNKEKSAYERRHSVGVIADQKSKHADELRHFPEAPIELLSISELIEQQQSVLLKNAENQKLRDEAVQINRAVYDQASECEIIEEQIISLQSNLKEQKTRLNALRSQQETAHKSIEELNDESTAELETQIKHMDEINAKVRANLDKEKAIEDSRIEKEKYMELTKELDAIRKLKVDLLESADLPLEGLSVVEGQLTYNDKHWDCMSGSEQLRVSTAIVRKLNPKCGFVLLDKLEQMDTATLAEFGEWCGQEDLQVIATRVSTGPECSIIIDDGTVVKKFPVEMSSTKSDKWKGGF